MKWIDTSNEKAVAIAAATLGYTIWGFSFIFIRIALRNVTPEMLLSARFFVATLMMTLLMLSGKAKISWKGKKIGGVLLLGLLEPVLYFFLESYGTLYTNATLAGTMMALNPVLSVVLAVLLLKEKPSRRQLLFMWLPIGGVAMITLSTYSSGTIRPVGVLLLAAACLVAAFTKIVNRKVSSDFTAFERTYTMMLMGFVVFTAMALVQGAGDLGGMIRSMMAPTFLLAVFVLGALCSFTAFMLVNFAAAKLEVTQISIFPSLSTVISITSGALILGEPFSFVSIVGAALIIVGIWNVAK